MKLTKRQKNQLFQLQLFAGFVGREIVVGDTAIFIKNPSVGSFIPCDSLDRVAIVLEGIK